jgi:hypothetical protein
MTTLSLIAKQDYLEKVARTRDPIRAISEFVWNALDADATSISVEFVMNVLGGIQEIVIRDNGVGWDQSHPGVTRFRSSGRFMETYVAPQPQAPTCASRGHRRIFPKEHAKGYPGIRRADFVGA